MVVHNDDAPWELTSDMYGNHTLIHTAMSHWEVVYAEDSEKLTLDYEGYEQWKLTHWYASGSNWVLDIEDYAYAGIDITSLTFENAGSASRTLMTQDAVAPKGWVQTQGYATSAYVD